MSCTIWSDDPLETRNLVRDPAHRDVVARMNRELFEGLAATDGLYIPLAPDRGGVQNLRRRAGQRRRTSRQTCFVPEAG